MVEEEIWKPIPGYEGLYSASNLGRIRRDADGPLTKKGLILKPQPNRSGHLRVSLCREGKVRKMQVHRLVALTFIGTCPHGLVTCHTNGNPGDNRLVNLRYDSRQENMMDNHRLGKISKGQILNMEQAVEAINLLDTGEPAKVIAKRFGVPLSTIKNIKHGRSWRRLRERTLTEPHSDAAA